MLLCPPTSLYRVGILADLEIYDRDTYIKSIKRSVTRTYIILNQIDEMLNLYRAYCESSCKPEDLRRYRILKGVYFENVSISELCQRESIDDSTYYRDSRDNIEKLSALIFGVDGLSDNESGDGSLTRS